MLLTEIGRGSFGTVYKAIWRGGIAAAKILPFQAGSSILKEIELMRYLHVCLKVAGLSCKLCSLYTVS